MQRIRSIRQATALSMAKSISNAFAVLSGRSWIAAASLQCFEELFDDPPRTIGIDDRGYLAGGIDGFCRRQAPADRFTALGRLAGLGALAAGGGAQQVIFIHDPVAGASYALDPGRKTANKSAWAGRGAAARPFGAAIEARREMRAAGLNQSVKTEALGTMTIDGLPVQGTRTTITIPAGAIGNEAPIQGVTERWYSADLQMAVLTKRSDPRSGETVTRLTNVNRSEPSPALFQVPPDYKVIERPAARFRSPAGAAEQ